MPDGARPESPPAGPKGRRNARTAALAAAGALLALAPALFLFDFTVDDALIPARYAAHLAQGQGYRFNAEGPVTDGVTPLGLPFLYAPFAAQGPLAALAAAKLLGLGAWLFAAALLAVIVDRATEQRARFLALLLVPASAPLAAWSVAGLETPFATALVTVGVSLLASGRPLAGAGAAGLAAALRPEMLPFALVLALLDPPGAPSSLATRRLGRAALALAPFAAVVAIRLAVFGRPTPLSALAKPSDTLLGAQYALACFLLTGPLALVAPRALLRADGFTRGLSLAVVVHFVAVALAGGDWMPLSRLVVPVLPAAVVAVAHLARVASWPATALRVALALAGELWTMARVGPTAARVGPDRARLVQELGPALAGARVVAALDVGWVGACTDATLVDLAGLTDPAIAVLPGGHTTKRIPRDLLDARRVDALVLLLAPGARPADPWTESAFARGVEQRLAWIPGAGADFAPAATSPMPGLPYLVLRRREGGGERSP